MRAIEASAKPRVSAYYGRPPTEPSRKQPLYRSLERTQVNQRTYLPKSTLKLITFP